MRASFNLAVIFILSAAIVVAPMLAAPLKLDPASAPAPLGVVVHADRASIGTDITIGGATIYDGDLLETDANGALRALLGGSQIYLREGTSVSVHGFPSGYSAGLAHGTVVASSGDGQTFEILAVGVTIRPTGPEATVAQVTWISPNQLLLTSARGSINVSLDDEVKTIDAGSTYRMEVVSDPVADQQQQGALPAGRAQPAGHHHHRRMLWWVVGGGGIGAGAGVLLWKALESPSGL